MQGTMNRIAIIGAGASGRLLALNLRRQAPASVRILLIDRDEEQCMGPAYRDDADNLLLNVPAERMGAFPDHPEQFLEWAQQNSVPARLGDFLQRSLYRNYVLDLMRQQHEQAGGARIEQVRGEATDIETAGGCATVHMEAAGDFVAEKAVLAVGNFLPRQPQIENRAALESRRYVRNPWDGGVLDRVSRNETVFLIGTGQTMVDLVLALNKHAHAGRIVAVSRHGVLPFAHQRTAPYPSFFNEIAECTRLLHIFRKVRHHIQRAQSIGIDQSAVIDSLRPDTQTLWLRLPDEEKRRFLRHVFRHWEVIRSRIPPQSEAIIESMRASGQLQIVAGRIRDLVETEATIKVHYTLRAGARVIEEAGVVINCIGPESDYRRVEDSLVKNLMRRGLIRPGPADLGIDALPNGAVIDRDGVSSGVLYTIGSPMKGVLWEVLAIPDIRVQAQRLAQLLASNSSDSLSPA